MKRWGALACLFLVVGCGSSSKPATTPGPIEPAGPTAEAPAPAPEPAPAPAPAPPVAKSLYDRLGGQDAITAVVGEFVANVAADGRINQRFFNTDIDNLKRLLVEFVCMATGGPCQYTGRDMATTHAGMDLVDDEFNALVENLVKALDKFKVPEKEKGELLGALGPLKPQIVVAADKLKPIDDKKLAAVTKLAGTVKDKGAQDLLNMAVVAGKRGQRSYAEQLFTRAEMITGAKTVASVAGTFRAGAPKRIETPTTKVADTAPQPKVAGGSETDEPKAAVPPKHGSLEGALMIDGKAPSGLGVVMLWPATGAAKKRQPKQRVIEQRNKEFAPHVLAVPVGSTVSFPNYDTIFHNVFSISKPKAFDLGMYKSGETREIKIDKPGIIRLGCNLHAAMSAYIIAVDAPNYVIANADGTFKFNTLAPGKYKVQAWNERSGEPMTSEVTIKEGANEVKLDLKGGAQVISPDKFGAPRQ